MEFIANRKTFEKARALVNVYGDDARDKAARMADECFTLGFTASGLDWQNICAAVDLLLAGEAEQTLH